MKKIFYSCIFVFIKIAYTQTIDFVYIDLKGCDKDCRNNSEASLTSIVENTDSVFIYVSNGQTEVFL